MATLDGLWQFKVTDGSEERPLIDTVSGKTIGDKVDILLTLGSGTGITSIDLGGIAGAGSQMAYAKCDQPVTVFFNNTTNGVPLAANGPLLAFITNVATPTVSVQNNGGTAATLHFALFEAT